MAKIKATCGACFSTVALNADGRIARHGWREVGGRKAGQHGHAWHVGNCFGAGRLPYETTVQTTVDYVDHVVFPAAASAQGEVARLAARPTLHIEVKTDHVRNAPVATIILTPNDEEGYWFNLCHRVEGLPEQRVSYAPSYENVLRYKTRDANAHLSAIMESGALCAEKIAAWTSTKAA